MNKIKNSPILFLIWRIATLGISWAARGIPSQLILIPENAHRLGIPEFFWIWGNFDGSHYLGIADMGYRWREYGFFPLFPMLIRFLFRGFHIPYIYGGLLISHFAFIGALVMIYQLAKVDQKLSLVYGIFFSMFLFPTSFFYTAIYNDSLFLFFVLVCFYFARTKQWGYAVAVGMLATLARINGLILLLYLVCEYMFSEKTLREVIQCMQTDALGLMGEIRNKTKHGWKRMVWFFCIPLAFVGYLAYIHVTFGNWYMVFSSMSVWGQDRMVFPLQVVWRYIKIMTLAPSWSLPYGIAMAEFLFVFVYCFFLIYGIKRISFAYWIFFLVSIILPSMTGTFQGMPRYGLHIYPFFLLMADWLSEQTLFVRKIVYCASFTFLVIFEALFVRGYFVA